MRSRMPLGNFLVAYRETVGVRNVFEIPGDLVANLFMKVGHIRGLQVETLVHNHPWGSLRTGMRGTPAGWA